MLLHERWAVATLLLIAFGRAIAEVGAVMIVGGNIDGVTRVMTTTIALETSKGDLPLALALGLVLLARGGAPQPRDRVRPAQPRAADGATAMTCAKPPLGVSLRVRRSRSAASRRCATRRCRSTPAT